MEALLKSLTGGELVGWSAAILVLLTGLIQISPIKLNPWTWLARKIGRAINGELMVKVDKLEGKINEMDAQDAREKAERYRAQILRFADECRRGVQHSEEHFKEVMRTIVDYDAYCNAHEQFENGFTEPAAEFIREIYAKCVRGELEFL